MTVGSTSSGLLGNRLEGVGLEMLSLKLLFQKFHLLSIYTTFFFLNKPLVCLGLHVGWEGECPFFLWVSGLEGGAVRTHRCTQLTLL